MTIYLKNEGEEIGKNLAGIGGAIGNISQHFMNPDKQYVDALRAAILKGTINPQDLNNMTPEEVAAKYKIKLKNTAQFTTNTPDAKTLAGRATADEIKRIMTTGTPQEREEFLSKQVGTLTSQQRSVGKSQETIASNQAALSTTELQAVNTMLNSSDPAVRAAALAAKAGTPSPDQVALLRSQKELAGMQSTQAKETIDRDTASRALNAHTISSIGGEKNLYTAYQQKKIDPAQLAAIMHDPDFKDVFEGQRADYWRKAEMDQREQLSSARQAGKVAQTDIFTRQLAMMAAKYGEYSGMSNPRDIATVLESPLLAKKYEGVAEKDVNPAERNMWEAVQAIKKAKVAIEAEQGKKGANEKLALDAEFRRSVGGDISNLMDPNTARKLGIHNEKDAAVIVDRINAEAQNRYGMFYATEPEKIPVYAYDKNGPRSERTGIDQPTLYQVNAPKGAETPKKNDVVSQSIAFIKSGNATLKEALDEPGLTAAQKDSIKIAFPQEAVKNLTSAPAPAGNPVVKSKEGMFIEPIAGTDSLSSDQLNDLARQLVPGVSRDIIEKKIEKHFPDSTALKYAVDYVEFINKALKKR